MKGNLLINETSLHPLQHEKKLLTCLPKIGSIEELLSVLDQKF